MAATWLVALVLSAPLTVRVLERQKPRQVRLHATSVRCDDEALGAAVELQVDGTQLRAGAKACRVVTTQGPSTTVTVEGQPPRTYSGTLTAVLEGAVVKLLNDVELETYLPSVVTAEAAGSPPAALEAQAVVSRTFARTATRRHHLAGYDVCDLAHCQVYRGADGVDAAAARAVEKTRGQVLLVGGMSLKPAFFHAACGGHTSAPTDVFGVDGAGTGARDTDAAGPLCRGMADFTWSWTVERTALAEALGAKPVGTAFEALRRDAGGRVLEVRSFAQRFSGDAFAAKVGRAFGYHSLRSLKVRAEEVEGAVRFSGSGVGHGVGLCQQGAKTLAAGGADAKSILQRYFPDARVGVLDAAP
ncbi:MAG: SpoIID/LytB domain-containing protein [Archangium sp.]|nr:SpoIID/LytB domain-containing protein [Archangium sp.]